MKRNHQILFSVVASAGSILICWANATDQKTGSVSAGNKSAVPHEVTRRSLHYYKAEVRPNLFSAPGNPEAKPVVKAPKVKAIPVPPVTIAEVNPFADWTYSGTIKAGEKIVALVENSKSHDGHYLRDGDTFMGAQVRSITDQMITLDAAGKPSLLAKSDNITLTPLSASASSAAPAAGGAVSAPGAPGMPAMGGFGGFNGGAMGDLTLQGGGAAAKFNFSPGQMRGMRNMMRGQFGRGGMGRRGG